jgi:hypothetical protein
MFEPFTIVRVIAVILPSRAARPQRGDDADIWTTHVSYLIFT